MGTSGEVRANEQDQKDCHRDPAGGKQEFKTLKK